MPFQTNNTKRALPAVIILLLISGFAPAKGEIIELNFAEPPVSGPDSARTLQSLVRVQGTGQFCQDGLYLMTHFGDLEGIFQKENQDLIDNPYIHQTWRFCSLFSTATENSVVMGRNWDNQNVGSIIVSLYHPPGGYSSISFCRSIDLGFGLKDLEELKSSPFAGKLLLAPFYAMDGINEHGLTVAVAGVRQTTHGPESDKEPVFVSFLVRKLLDRTKSIDEAVDLAGKHLPFDLDRNSLNGHYLIADSSGRSVVLEYDRDQLRVIHADKSWQALTNKPVYNVPDAALREKCWRYRSISETLESTSGRVDWNSGMNILRDVAQKGTTWSVIYSPPTKELYLSVYQDWDVIYHLRAL